MKKEPWRYGSELTVADFPQAAPLFADLHHHLSIEGVLQGVIRGRVFLSHSGETALLISPQGIFASGDPEDRLFLNELQLLLREDVLPRLAFDNQLDYVLFYPDEPRWEAALAELVGGLQPMRSGRMTLRYAIPALAGEAVSADEALLEANEVFFQLPDLCGREQVVTEILSGWESLAAFVTRGFGSVAVTLTEDGPEVIGWCLTDWVVGSACEIGIWTDEAHRGNGWAARMAKATLAEAARRGLTQVGWQCWANNIAAERTALSVGFQVIADYPVLFGWTHPLNNLLVNGNHYMRGYARYGVERDYARAASCYAAALDRGWDWGGDCTLYWNAASMFYLSGDRERAVHYYRIAVAKGFVEGDPRYYHEYVYRDEDQTGVARELGALL